MNAHETKALSAKRHPKALLISLFAALWMLSSGAWAEQTDAATEQKVTVYKSPTCGCCKKWVDHMEANGFQVETIEMPDLRMIKSMTGVKPQNASCHTAKVGGYVVEGHVPADDVKRMLRERPEIKGLTVPGMHMGSPGMEGPTKEKYDVLTINRDGSSEIYARH